MNNYFTQETPLDLQKKFSFDDSEHVSYFSNNFLDGGAIIIGTVNKSNEETAENIKTLYKTCEEIINDMQNKNERF